jgi:hypothetical protein
MARAPASWWKARRVKHRDAVILCVLSSAFLFAGELTNQPALRTIFSQYLAPYVDQPAVFVLNALLAGFAFTTAFGAVLVLLGGWYFLRGKVPRGRFLVGLGVGLTSLTLANRIAYAWLVQGTPLAYLSPLATSPTGIGILIGVVAHTLMGQYALLLKRHARQAWRRWRRARRASRS